MALNTQQLNQLKQAAYDELVRTRVYTPGVGQSESFFKQNLSDAIDQAMKTGDLSNVRIAGTGIGTNLQTLATNIFPSNFAKPTTTQTTKARDALVASGNMNPTQDDILNYVIGNPEIMGEVGKDAEGLATKTGEQLISTPLEQGTVEAATVNANENIGLSEDQLKGLNAASIRISQGNANDADRENVEYAKKTFGYNPDLAISEQPTIYRDSQGNIYDANKNILTPTQFREYTKSGAVEGGMIDAPKSSTTGSTTEGTVGTDATTGATTGNLTESNRIIDEAVKAGLVSLEDADLFKEVVKGFQGTDLNFDTIINEFEKVKETTIDPEFASRARQFARDLNVTRDQLTRDRARELENIGMSEENAIEQAQNDFEAAGMTFTGKAVETLGGRSAYAPEEITGQEGEKVILVDPNTGEVKFAIKGTTQYQDFINQGMTEKALQGNIQQNATLLKSSAGARYGDAFQGLLSQVEDTMGTEYAKGTGIQGQLAEGITGTEEKAQRVAEAETLTNLANLQKQAQDVGTETQINLNQ